VTYRPVRGNDRVSDDRLQRKSGRTRKKRKKKQRRGKEEERKRGLSKLMRSKRPLGSRATLSDFYCCRLMTSVPLLQHRAALWMREPAL